ncbi:hypothetical protein CDAR_566261 [Caerostris darwini]|uniref:Uncharacterized protein n=1 Tax=Caerostris darwini TaxID=1538125 RepID=A0AAV4UDM8_9ARAC|nr:hypothetical protein CDAR_566261 [Caerostris darwini]
MGNQEIESQREKYAKVFVDDFKLYGKIAPYWIKSFFLVKRILSASARKYMEKTPTDRCPEGIEAELNDKTPKFAFSEFICRIQ